MSVVSWSPPAQIWGVSMVTDTKQFWYLGGKKIKPGKPLHGSPPLSPKPPPKSPTRRKSNSDVSAPAESDL